MTDVPWPEWGAPRRSPETYHDRQHAGEVLERVSTPHGDFTVIRCQPCVLNHVVPLPDEAWLRTYYKDQFFQRAKPDYVRRYEEDRAWWEFWHHQTLALAETILPAPVQAGEVAPTVLDIGAGPGLFLDVAQRRGWVTEGLEPCEALALQVRQRGHAVHAWGFDRVMKAALLGEPPTPRYQLLHLYEVLEHVPDPQEFLLQAVELLAPGGLLHVVVPNDYAVMQLAACERYGLPHWWVHPPEHLTYFTAKTLQLLVRRAGFDILDFRGTYPLEQFILSGRVYVGNDALGRQIHQERMAWELNLDQAGLTDWLLEQYRQNMAYPYQGGMGREIVCLARKREA